MFFKVIKSGFRVEDCRLAHGDRLARYLTIMSIVAWRLFMITIIARTDPSQCCSSWLTTNEWRVLIHKTMKSGTFPDKPPTIKEAVDCIAKLGGHLGRKSIPERCPGLVCGAPLRRRDGLTPGKDSLLSGLATCAKMIATR